MTSDYRIQIGFAGEHRATAARLYAEAFRGKFANVLGDVDAVAWPFRRLVGVSGVTTMIKQLQNKVGQKHFP